MMHMPAHMMYKPPHMRHMLAHMMYKPAHMRHIPAHMMHTRYHLLYTIDTRGGRKSSKCQLFEYFANTIIMMLVSRTGRYQKFHITIITTVNIPIIDSIAISAELTVLQVQSISLMLLSKKSYDIHSIDDNIVVPILRY